MPDKEIFVLKIVWKKSIASLHRLTQGVQRANLKDARRGTLPEFEIHCYLCPHIFEI